MRVIASANQKGGCGKTTTAINLSSSLSLKEKRVLLIDFDPQAHATMGLNITPSDLGKSIYHVITPKDYQYIGIEDILVPIKENFDLAPSSLILSAVEQELSGLEGRENRLFRAIQELNKTYDYVVIDCPPSIGHLCFNALRACEEVIIPIDMSLFSLRGVAKLLEIIILLKDKTGHDIKSRALITMYDRRTRYSRVVLEKVKTEFGNNVFDTVIRYNIRLRETADCGMPVGDYDKTAIGHIDYENLAEEIISSEEARTYPDLNTLSQTEDILQKTEEYIDMSVTPSEDERPVSEMTEFSTYSPQSNYSEMVEAIATRSTDSYFGDEDI
jgi:chromosome partitioning protein